VGSFGRESILHRTISMVCTVPTPANCRS
jgi:hypothetical protein